MNNKIAITTYISIITSNENRLKDLIKRECGWMDNKTRLLHMLSAKDFRLKGTDRLKAKGWKMFYENGNKQLKKLG